MNYRKALLLAGASVALISALYAEKRQFRVYPSMEGYDNIALPPDYQSKTEWVQARLMYPQHPQARFSRFRYGGGLPDWTQGGTSWTQVPTPRGSWASEEAVWGRPQARAMPARGRSPPP